MISIITIPILSFSLYFFPSSLANHQIPAQESKIIVIINVDQTAPNDGIKLGSISIPGNRDFMNCSYTETIEQLKVNARIRGANVIKITEHRLPDLTNNCDRIKADFYKVEDFRKYETEIMWRQDRKLTWKDFKAKAPLSSQKDVAALTFCGIRYYSSRVLLTSPAKISVANVFYCNKSWVRKSQKKPSILRHEQLHFDLSEVYARKMRKALQEANLTGATLNTIGNSIFQMTNQEYQIRQDQYDKETNHGINQEKQIEWNLIVRKELNELHEYEY